MIIDTTVFGEFLVYLVPLTHTNYVGLPVNVTVVQQRGLGDGAGISEKEIDIAVDNKTIMTIENLSSLSFDLSKDDDFSKALKSRNGKIDKNLTF